ncbi:MAG: VWA domain-containing protein [Spirochaetes bacterium]|nr:VWA domain-containing protein [Spirochaetota bacterium]
MRRPNRDFNIFNISMLDVMTGALGAVMIIMIVLLTQKIGEESMSCQDIKEELTATTEKLIESNNELKKTKEELQKKTAADKETADKVFNITGIIDATADKVKLTIDKISDLKKELFQSTPQADEDVMAFRIPKKIVMIIDLSGSMAPENNKYNEDRLSQVKAALKMFIAGMDREYYIDIVFFPAFEENINRKIFPDFKIKPEISAECKAYDMRDEAYDNQALTCYKYGYFEGNLKRVLSEEDKYEFYKKIACLKAYHDTPTKAALDFVLTDNRYKDAQGVILFSDGQPDSIRKKQSTKDELLEYIKEKNSSGKKIFTVGIGAEFRNQEDTLAVDFLKKLAARNNGFYIGF